MKSFWQKAPRHKRFYRGPARDKNYLAWIRTLPCLICGDKAEAAHTGKDGGMKQKSSDYSAVPLCSDHHTQAGRSYHHGTKRFEARHGLDFAAITLELKAHYERKTMPQYETLLRHKELLLLNTFISESSAEVERSLDDIREDSSDPDWQYLKGQRDALREVSQKIRSIMADQDQQRFLEVKPVEEAA